MNRLTEKDAYWIGEEFWLSAREPDAEEIEAVYERLKYYEDLAEAGQLVELPYEYVWLIVDRNTEYATVMMRDIRDLRITEVDGIDKCGYYWSTKEGAEAELERGKTNGSNI